MAYLDNLRQEHMAKGRCILCGKVLPVLERHHEKYDPERTLNICHDCHFRVHFQPWLLTDAQKTTLLRTRENATVQILQSMIDEYKPPSRPHKPEQI